MAIKE